MNALKKMIIEYAEYIRQEFGLTLLIGVEQELNAIEVQKIDVETTKEIMCNEALSRLAAARSAGKQKRARNILDALQHATCAEHLLNIEVYDKMYGKLEHRGTPEIHSIGYYDMPGNIEFRTLPMRTPLETMKVFKELIESILFYADKLGLKIHWRSEHLNLSVWNGDHNLTSIPGAFDKDFSGRILVGMLDTNEEVRLLIPGQAKPGRYVNGGPTRLDSIRIVNNDNDPAFHRFEQRDTFRYGKGKLNLPYRLLIMLEGIVKGIHHPEFTNCVKNIRAVHISIKDREAITINNLSDTYRGFMRIELDENYKISNIDALFAKHDYLFGGNRIGKSITTELTGEGDTYDEDKVKAFYKAMKFTDTSLILPCEPEFDAMNYRIAELGIKSVKVYDSIRVSEIFIPDAASGEERILTLRERWGNKIVDIIAGKKISKNDKLKLEV